MDRMLRHLIAPFGWLLVAAAVLGCASNGTDTVEARRPVGPYADLGDVTLYFEEHGRGYPVLLLHGGFGNLQAWAYQVPALAERFRVITMDSRGHGRSTDGPGPITYSVLAADAVAMLDYLGIPKAHIVGWSDGAVAALNMCIDSPERVDKVVAIGTNIQFEGSTEPSFEAFVANKALFSRTFDLFLGWDYRARNPNPDHWPVFIDKIHELWTGECFLPRRPGQPCAASLGEIAAHVLVMAGEHETILKEHTELIARSIPNGQLVYIPRGTHMVLLERPEQVNEAILNFL